MGAGMETPELGNPSTPVAQRTRAFGQGETLNWLDRLSFWLSCRRIKSVVGDFAGLRLADIGCGYDAPFAHYVRGQAKSIVVADLAIAPETKREPGVRAIEGRLPDCLTAIDDQSIDVVFCNSVIEHLWEPLETLREIFRICAPGGVAFINAPAWRAKNLLEFLAFRLGLLPESEIDDHKMYYDPKDLWPLLVRSGFRPKDLRVFRHKFRFGTLAICRKPHADATGFRDGRGDGNF